MIDRCRIDELREDVGADDFAEVVALFCEEVEETLDRLRQHRSPALADDLHFLKGSALNIGMSEVGALCLRAEQSLRSDPALAPDVAEIARVFRASRDALRQMLCP